MRNPMLFVEIKELAQIGSKPEPEETALKL
jgi:hypothetical protein